MTNSFNSDEQRKAFFANLGNIGKDDVKIYVGTKSPIANKETVSLGAGPGKNMVIHGHAPGTDELLSKMKTNKVHLGNSLLEEATNPKNREHYTVRRSTLDGSEVLVPKFYIAGKKTPRFDKAIESIKKMIQKEKAANEEKGWTGHTSKENDLEKIIALKGYPTDSRQVRGVSPLMKSKLLKAELEDEYPDTKWSVRMRDTGSITANYVGGKYPYGAKHIGEHYENRGDTDSMSDYFNYDTYVFVHEDWERNSKNPQTIVDTPVDLLSYRIHSEMDKDYAKYSKLYGGHYNLGTSKMLAEMLLGLDDSTGINGIEASDFKNIYDEFVKENQ